MKSRRIQCENQEHHENLKVPYKNHENIQNHRIQCDDHENHEHLTFHMRIMIIMKS